MALLAFFIFLSTMAALGILGWMLYQTGYKDGWDARQAEVIRWSRPRPPEPEPVRPTWERVRALPPRPPYDWQRDPT